MVQRTVRKVTNKKMMIWPLKIEKSLITTIKTQTMTMKMTTIKVKTKFYKTLIQISSYSEDSAGQVPALSLAE